MPEIKNEIPSDDELAAYLDEWLKTSASVLLTCDPAINEHYHVETLEALSYLSAANRHLEFLNAVKSSLFRSLQRMNRLPRTDLFWRNTNCRPTIFKLTDFCERLLLEDPDHVECLWALSALSVAQTGEFARDRWAQLYRLKAVRLEVVAFAAMLLEMAGSPDSLAFSEFVTMTGSNAEMAPLLRDLAQEGGKLLGDWSRSVAALLTVA